MNRAERWKLLLKTMRRSKKLWMGFTAVLLLSSLCFSAVLSFGKAFAENNYLGACAVIGSYDFEFDLAYESNENDITEAKKMLKDQGFQIVGIERNLGPIPKELSPMGIHSVRAVDNWDILPELSVIGKIPKNGSEILVESGYASRKNLMIGDVLTFQNRVDSESIERTISGMYQDHFSSGTMYTFFSSADERITYEGMQPILYLNIGDNLTVDEARNFLDDQFYYENTDHIEYRFPVSSPLFIPCVLFFISLVFALILFILNYSQLLARYETGFFQAVNRLGFSRKDQNFFWVVLFGLLPFLVCLTGTLLFSTALNQVLSPELISKFIWSLFNVKHITMDTPLLSPLRLLLCILFSVLTAGCCMAASRKTLFKRAGTKERLVNQGMKIPGVSNPVLLGQLRKGGISLALIQICICVVLSCFGFLVVQSRNELLKDYPLKHTVMVTINFDAGTPKEFSKTMDTLRSIRGEEEGMFVLETGGFSLKDRSIQAVDDEIYERVALANGLSSDVQGILISAEQAGDSYMFSTFDGEGNQVSLEETPVHYVDSFDGVEFVYTQHNALVRLSWFSEFLETSNSHNNFVSGYCYYYPEDHVKTFSKLSSLDHLPSDVDLVVDDLIQSSIETRAQVQAVNVGVWILFGLLLVSILAVQYLQLLSETEQMASQTRMLYCIGIAVSSIKKGFITRWNAVFLTAALAGIAAVFLLDMKPARDYWLFLLVFWMIFYLFVLAASRNIEHTARRLSE